MEISDQSHAPVVLTSRKIALVHTDLVGTISGVTETPACPVPDP
jgi:hypothetical protein